MGHSGTGSFGSWTRVILFCILWLLQPCCICTHYTVLHCIANIKLIHIENHYRFILVITPLAEIEPIWGQDYASILYNQVYTCLLIHSRVLDEFLFILASDWTETIFILHLLFMAYGILEKLWTNILFVHGKKVSELYKVAK